MFGLKKKTKFDDKEPRETAGMTERETQLFLSYVSIHSKLPVEQLKELHSRMGIVPAGSKHLGKWCKKWIAESIKVSILFEKERQRSEALKRYGKLN